MFLLLSKIYIQRHSDLGALSDDVSDGMIRRVFVPLKVQGVVKVGSVSESDNSGLCP